MCFWAILGGEDGSPDPSKRIIEGIGDALLEGDNRIVGDIDTGRTDVGTTLGDVTIADSELVLDLWNPIHLVHRVHLEICQPDQSAGPTELVELAIFAQNVTGVLADEALDTHPEFLCSLSLELTELPIGLLGTLNWCDRLSHLIIPRHIAD